MDKNQILDTIRRLVRDNKAYEPLYLHLLRLARHAPPRLYALLDGLEDKDLNTYADIRDACDKLRSMPGFGMPDTWADFEVGPGERAFTLEDPGREPVPVTVVVAYASHAICRTPSADAQLVPRNRLYPAWDAAVACTYARMHDHIWNEMEQITDVTGLLAYAMAHDISRGVARYAYVRRAAELGAEPLPTDVPRGMKRDAILAAFQREGLFDRDYEELADGLARQRVDNPKSYDAYMSNLERYRFDTPADLIEFVSNEEE